MILTFLLLNLILVLKCNGQGHVLANTIHNVGMQLWIDPNRSQAWSNTTSTNNEPPRDCSDAPNENIRKTCLMVGFIKKIITLSCSYIHENCEKRGLVFIRTPIIC